VVDQLIFPRFFEFIIKSPPAAVLLSALIIFGFILVLRRGRSDELQWETAFLLNLGLLPLVLLGGWAGYLEYRREQGETFFKPVAYSVSKSALYNLTRYLAAYWGDRSVRVSTVTFAGVFNNQHPRFLERYLPKVPLGRMGKPEEFGQMVEAICENINLNGTTIRLDGGIRMQPK
jgi:NAD(P)-dependent dehydrogenase (short-subunit alcohol dehydrogenase family)